MKRSIQRITTLAAVSSFLWTTSCRTSDTENTLATGGPVTISAILDGIEYGGQSGDPQASAGKMSVAANNDRQSRTTMLDVSSYITVETITNNTPSNASAKLNTMAVDTPIPNSGIDMRNLPVGARVRVAAYIGTSTTTSQFKDYIVQTNNALAPENGDLTLTHNQPYTIVVYSNGTPNLPDHSSSIAYTNDTNSTDLQKDFMYRKYTNFIPNGDIGINKLMIRLQHKTTQVITNLSFSDELRSITTPAIGTNYTNGTINLNTNNQLTEGYVANGSTASSPITLAPNNSGSYSVSYYPIKINGASGAAGATTTGKFTATIVNANPDGGTDITRNVDAPFQIKPGYKTNLNIVQGRFGANIGGIDRLFMCHNLGADFSKDPFTAAAEIHGAKSVWGVKDPGLTQKEDQDTRNTSSKTFNSSPGTGSDYWNSTSGGENNPCPTGYRVPSRTEFYRLLQDNTWKKIGADEYGPILSVFPGEKYNTAYLITSKKSGSSLKMLLPMTGLRNSNNYFPGSPTTSAQYYNNYGNQGGYWTSTIEFGNPIYLHTDDGNVNPLPPGGPNTSMAVRCIRMD